MADRFQYRALRPDGHEEKGSIVVSDSQDVSAALAARGLFLLEIRSAHLLPVRPRTIPVPEMATGLRILSELSRSGMPLARALATMDEMSLPGWQSIVPTLRETIRSGKSLAAGLRYSGGFPDVVVGLVQAGEAGGRLSEAIRRAAEITEQRAQLRSAIVGALAYPAVLATAGIASISLMVGIVLPKFASLLAEFGQTLPASTRLILNLTDVARLVAFPGLMAAVFGGLAWRLWTTHEAGRGKWHAILLALPFVGRLRLAGASCHVLAALGALLESGVPMAAALTHAAQATGDAAVTARMGAARQLVTEGHRLSRALGETRAISRTSIQLARAGEDSGSLPAMLMRAAQMEHDSASRLIKTAVRLIEPALVIAIGGIIAGIAAALLQAVYSVRPVS